MAGCDTPPDFMAHPLQLRFLLRELLLKLFHFQERIVILWLFFFYHNPLANVTEESDCKSHPFLV